MADQGKFFQAKVHDIFDDVDAVNQFAASATIATFHQFEGHMDTLSSLQIRFADLKDAVMKHNATVKQEEQIDLKKDLKRISSLISTIKGKYFQVKADFESKAQPASNVQVSHVQSVVSSSGKNLKLDKIKIKTFNGDLSHWLGFYESFKELVHNDATLKDIEKFHYLLSHLEGEPLKIAQRYSITSANYSLVIKALEDRYNSKRLLLSHLVGEVVSFKPEKFDLKVFLQQFQGTKSQLEKLGLNNIFEDFYFQICYSYLPNFWKAKVDDHFSSDDIPKLNEFFDYILTQTKSSENRNYARYGSTRESKPENFDSNSRSKQFKRNSFLARNPTGQVNACLLCTDPHALYQCKKFQGLSVDDRFLFVKTHNVCFNCLRVREKNHTPCPSNKMCKNCNKPHHTLLHKDNRQGASVEAPDSNSVSPNDGVRTCHARQVDSQSSPKVHSAVGTSNVLLGTLQAFIGPNEGGIFKSVHCLVDPCSEISLITQELTVILGLKVSNDSLKIHGVNDAETRSLGVTEITLRSRKSQDEGFSVTVTAHVVQEITTQLPSKDLDYTAYCRLAKFHLADRLFYKRKSIDILLGCAVFTEIITNPKNNRTFIEGSPALLYSKFGYIVLGKTPIQNSDKSIQRTLLTKLSEKQEEMEDGHGVQESLLENQMVEEFYKRTTYREEDGTYVVSLPFKDSQRPPSNLTQASQRFASFEKKMTKDPVLKDQHHAQFQDYLTLGHMSVASSPGKYYIPYHYVVKPDSSTTQYRAVFDASSKEPGQLSLNDCLFKGPNLYNDLSEILMRFQTGGKYTLTADLSKCYRRIKINPQDAQFQHCLYRDQDFHLRDLQLNCVVFGLSSSPYLALRTLKQLVQDEGKDYPLASLAVLKEFYMDNLASSRSSVQEVKTLVQELEGLCSKGNFPIHKYASNSEEILRSIEDRKKENLQNFTDDSKGISVLGLKYDTSKDEFLFFLSSEGLDKPTKRNVLSFVLNLFDPQGFMQPVVFWSKVYLNKLWKANLAWDSPIVGQLLKDWENFLVKLRFLRLIRIPRYIPVDVSVTLNLIGTCDASLIGIAANVYIQCVLGPNKGHCQLIRSKSKVVNKQQTIPRLELEAAKFLSNLVQRVIKAMDVTFNHIILFSDSQAALGWIKSNSMNSSVYVRNRVRVIRQLTQGFNWGYIEGCMNPSDLATRGLSAAQFWKQHEKWLYGPAWFSKPIVIADPRYFQVKVCHARVVHNDEFLTDCFSITTDFAKLVRIFAYVAKFIRNARLKHTRQFRPQKRNGFPLLSALDLQASTNLLARLSQQLHFSSELVILKKIIDYEKLVRVYGYVLSFIENLKSKPPKQSGSVKLRDISTLTPQELRRSDQVLRKFSQQLGLSPEIFPTNQVKHVNRHMSTLNPQLTRRGILVVGGRLGYSNLSERSKHPFILSNKCKFSRMIAHHFHEKHYHAGPTLTVAMIRARFWIINGKNLVKNVIAKCNRCRRFEGKPMQQIMADLPRERVTPSRPFSYTGCDLGGPFLIKTSKLRKAPQQKAYFVIFVCMSTKACHIEALTELSTECFLASFDRFTSRRGLIKCLFSDCGKNFIGAKSEIQKAILFFKANSDQLFSDLAMRGVEWKLNPPYSPHMGGIWERQVRSIKDHLFKQVNPNILTYEEFNTFLTHIEALLNSRPLQPLDDNPESLEVLTPAHFLIGGPLFTVPRAPLNLNKSLKSRWLMIQQCSQALWHRWKTEYLHGLQQRFKWKTPKQDITLGQMVFITDINAAPLSYPLGRVVELIQSKDGRIRSAKIKTSSGFYVRPIVKLVPLYTDPE